MKRSLLLSLLAAAFVSAGCGEDHLETGYAYTPLGDSSTKRRGYYADPFSPEARAAQTDTKDESSAAPGRRMVPGQ